MEELEFGEFTPTGKVHGVNDKKLPSLGPTWWVFDSEPGLDDIMEQAGDSLKQMREDLGIYPFQAEGQDRIFLARYEFPQYEADFQWPEAVLADTPDAYAWIDFLGGFPIDCTELLAVIGQYSTKPDQVVAMSGNNKPFSPVPDQLFYWPDEGRGKVVLNKTALIKDNAQMFAENLIDPAPNFPHFWLRVNLNNRRAAFPVPGEFFGMAVRLFPGEPWGRQQSSPFLYSGNWLDTVFYTSVVVQEVQDPTEERPYPLYTVQWRKHTVAAKSSDFAEYQVGDRVTILRVADKPSQTWKDDDTQEFNEESWVIAPISFYGEGE